MSNKKIKSGILGAVIGSIVAFFFSPKSGKENRKDFSDKIHEYNKQLSSSYNKLRENIAEHKDEISDDLKEQLKNLSSKAKEMNESLKQQAAKLGDNASDLKDVTMGEVDKLGSSVKQLIGDLETAGRNILKSVKKDKPDSDK